MAYTNSSGEGGEGRGEKEYRRRGYCHVDGTGTMEMMW
jgi:hypothetical protein